MLNQHICNAIQNRQTLTFSYHGFPRTVEPHAYGVDQNGHDVIRAYQVGGSSESGEYRGWKLFHVVEMFSLTLQQNTFSKPRDGYKRGDKGMARIYCEL